MWQVTAPPAPPVFQVPDPVIVTQDFPMLPPWVTLPPDKVMLIAVAFIAACAIVLFPLMRAIGRRIEGRGTTDPALRAELEQMRARLAEVDSLQHRVAELEERLDFAERILAHQREASRLGPGGD